MQQFKSYSNDNTVVKIKNPLSPDPARPQLPLHQQACVDHLNRPIYALFFAKNKEKAKYSPIRP